MRKICREEKCNNYVWGSGYCICHQPKKPLKRFPLPKIGKNKLVEAVKDFKESEPNKMHEFFLSIWGKRKHFSELSNEFLGNECLTIFFHHILPKGKFPEAELDKDNIILLTFAEHQKVEQDIYFYEEINKRRIVLLRKYRPI